MADSSVIADVSTTLETVLNGALSFMRASAALQDLQETPPRDTVLGIFLFEVAEDPSSRNRSKVRASTPPDIALRKPPMALLLKYLLTPSGGDIRSQQMILGRAMQFLYDNSILSGTDLTGTLAGTNDALKVTLAPLNLEERSRVWHAVQKPYRLSVSYEVRVVNLDSETEEKSHPISERTLNYATPKAIS